MAELIVDLDYSVTDASGTEYYVSVAAEIIDGEWEAWLEFVPLDDSDVLVTSTETHQTTRAAVEHWAAALTEVYVEGAFERAVPVGRASPSSRTIARVLAADPDLCAPPAGIDPFVLIAEGKAVLRAALRPLSRPELLGIISAYDLNPARKSLGWLTHAQLVTFIATAVETQILQRGR